MRNQFKRKILLGIMTCRSVTEKFVHAKNDVNIGGKIGAKNGAKIGAKSGAEIGRKLRRKLA